MTAILTIIILLTIVFLPYLIGYIIAKRANDKWAWYDKWGVGFAILFVLILAITLLYRIFDVCQKIAIQLSPYIQTLINNLNKPL